jgi:hypothetical protein
MQLDKCIWALAAALLAAGCSDLGEPLHLSAHAELSTSTLDFGTVAVSASATRSVVVSNSGGSDLHGSASVACGGFALQSGGGAFTVPPRGEHTVVVVYAPSDTGGSTCELVLGAGIPPVTLSGAGALQAAGARCALSDTTLDFGTGAVGGSRQAGFSITNSGTAGLLLNVVPSCGDFVVVSGGGRSTLAAGGTLAVSAQFLPSVGGAVSCSISIGPGCPEVRVHGFATSVSFANDLEPIMLSQGCVSCHFDFARSASQIVNVRSVGYAPAVRVKPFDLLNSVLYQKVTNTGRYGEAMPQGTTGLPAAQAEKFRRWILEGAHDN